MPDLIKLLKKEERLLENLGMTDFLYDCAGYDSKELDSLWTKDKRKLDKVRKKIMRACTEKLDHLNLLNRLGAKND